MTARAMSPISSARSTPVTSDFQSPRATARTASVIFTSGRLMRCDSSSMMPAKTSTDVTAAAISHYCERAAFDLADADQLVAQGVQLADRRERAGAPLVEQRVAARPEAAVPWCAAARSPAAPQCSPTRRKCPRPRSNPAREHQHTRALEPGELLQHRPRATQRAVRDQRGEHVAEVVEDRLGDDEGERRRRGSAERTGKLVGERQRAAHDPRALAVVVAQYGQDLLGERTVVQGPVRRHDIDLVARGAEHPQLGVDHQDAVDVGGLRGAAEQLADRDTLARESAFTTSARCAMLSSRARCLRTAGRDARRRGALRRRGAGRASPRELPELLACRLRP
jgi:hypothetical protein